METDQRLSSESVREFWFGDLDPDNADLEERVNFWFAAGPDVDAEILRRFGPAVERALAGRVDAWRDAPRDRLALVILLDQFPRNIHRGTAKAFAGDRTACVLSLEAIEARVDLDLSILERAFLYMPLQHAEDAAVQKRSVQAFAHLLEESPQRLQPGMKQFLASARSHQDIIRRFGRFPHRNDILGRECSEAEMEYLRTPGAPFSSK